VRLERGEPAVTPAHARRDLVAAWRASPQRQQAREVVAVVDRSVCRETIISLLYTKPYEKSKLS